MIELATESRLLARFVSELAQTSPRARPAPPDLRGYDLADVEAARLAWATRIFDEYRSVAIFSELLGLLTEYEAPFAALCTVQRLIGDELRHTQVTAQVVEWLGGSHDLEIDLHAPGLPPRTESGAERALRIVAREIVVAEEESVLALAAYRDATTEPSIRAVLELLLVDEVRHAAAGRALLSVFEHGRLAAATADLRAQLPALAAEDRAHLRATYSAGARASDGAGRALGACVAPADLDAIWARTA